MIISNEFLQGIQGIFQEQLQVPFANTVARWCMEYYKQYDQAPKKHIQDLFEYHSKNELKDEEKFLIEEFLNRLSKKHESEETFNVSYALDNAELYFRTIAAEKLHKKISVNLEKGRIDKVEKTIRDFERVVRPETNGVDPFDEETVTKAFSKDSSEILFKFPGVLGDTIGNLEREYLLAFFGIRGTGKTWWLLWTSLLGILKGYNVVFVSLEMSEKQIIKRIYQFINALPTYQKEINIPVFTEGIETIFKEKTRKELSLENSLIKLKAMNDQGIIKSKLKLLFYPSGTKTVADLKTQLTNMEYYDGFIPDLIVTDYANKFRSDHKGDKRHQVAEVWQQHKALAQERKCLVVTASQTNTARNSSEIGVGSSAESMEPENESDIILALNQKPEDKKRGILRMNITKHRHDDYDILKTVYVAQCLQIGRPYLDSRIEDK